jgi:hypothetical protein
MPPQPATIEPLYKEHLDEECDLNYIGTTNNGLVLIQWTNLIILYCYKVWFGT